MLEWRLRCKDEKVLLVDSLLQGEKCLYDGEEEEFDELNITEYMKNERFKFHDKMD